MARQIKYSEPTSYFPAEIRKKHFGSETKTTSKKTTSKKTTTKKK